MSSSKKKDNSLYLILFVICILFFLLCIVYMVREGTFFKSKDIDSPVVTLANISSDNSIDKYYAEKGNRIILTLKFSEALSGNPHVKINGEKASVVREEDKYIASIRIYEQSNEDTLATFEVFDYYDLSNNLGEKVSNTTDNSKVTIKALNQVIVPPEVSSIKITNGDLNIAINSGNNSIKLNTLVEPSNASGNITWYSSNSSVVTVNDGVLTAHGIGIATITAMCGGKSAFITVIVSDKEVEVSSITLNKSSATIYLNSNVKSISLTATVNPSNATNKNVIWKSSNSNVVSVNNGVVTAKSIGSAVITASVGNKKAICKITVTNKDNPVTSISLNKSSETLYLNDVNTTTLVANVKPTNATNGNVTWKSSNTSVAVVNNGVVTAKGLGSATITATAGGKSVTCKITVSNKIYSVTSVTLNKTSDLIYLNSGINTVKLIATVTPSNATNNTVTWNSNNTSVATVSDGTVSIKGLGSAIITATAEGKSASYTVNVRQKKIIVIGASQVGVMNNNNSSYTSQKGYTYSKSSNTLKFIYKGGSGIPYQYSENDGWGIAEDYINGFSSLKKYLDFHIYFPLSGNEIKKMSCDQISSSNSNIKAFASGYNGAIQKLKNAGYAVQGYVVSMHPVRTTESTKDDVVSNQNKNSCVAGYRSNYKYYKFNRAIKSVVLNNYSSNLKFESLLVNIMNVNDEGKNFSFKWDYYHTTDGIHWDSKTSQLYVKEMLDYSGDV